MDKPEGSATRYDKLATPRERVNTTDKMDPFKVKRGAMSYRITDSMNALAMPKKMYDPNEKKRASPTRASTLRPDNELAGKLKPLIRSPKNNLNLDTYAAMVLKNDIQCPTRIKKLARPKGQASSNNDTMDFF